MKKLIVITLTLFFLSGCQNNSLNKEQDAKIQELEDEIEQLSASKEENIVSDAQIKVQEEVKPKNEAKNTEIEKPNEIYFEGTVELESMYDGVFFISVKIDKGELAGKTESLYFRSGMEDSNSIDYTGNANFDGSGEGEGKRIVGSLIQSKGNFENYETGENDSKEIYRIKDVNYK